MKTTLLLAALVVLAGCSGEPTRQTDNAQAEALRAAVRAYSDAYLGGDAAAAHGLLSGRCRQRISRGEMDSLTAAAQDLYGRQAPISVVIERLGDGQARVTYTYPDPAINQTSEPWVFEDGWRQDDC